MRLTMESSLLARIVSLAASVAASGAKSIVPGAAGAQIAVTPESMTVAATDFDTGIRVRVAHQDTQAVPGAVTVPAHPLADFLKSLPAGPVTLALDKRLTAQAARSKAAWSPFTAEDTPDHGLDDQAEDEYTVTIEPAVFLGMIERTVYAAADFRRPHLMGVWLQGEPTRLRMTATSGHALGHAGMAVEGTGTCARMVPVDGCKALSRVLKGLPEAITVRVRPAYLRVDAGQIELRTKHLELPSFPDYAAIIRPAEGAITVTTATSPLRAAVARLRPINKMVRLSAAPDVGLTLTAEDAERDGEETVEATVTETGTFQAGAETLADALDAIANEDVVLRWSDAGGKPILWLADPSFPETMHMLAARV